MGTTHQEEREDACCSCCTFGCPDGDLGEGVGRRASFLSTQGSFTLSAGSNRAGNDEAHLLAESSLDDAPVLGDSSEQAEHTAAEGRRGTAAFVKQAKLATQAA